MGQKRCQDDLFESLRGHPSGGGEGIKRALGIGEDCANERWSLGDQFWNLGIGIGEAAGGRWCAGANRVDTTRLAEESAVRAGWRGEREAIRRPETWLARVRCCA